MMRNDHPLAAAPELTPERLNGARVIIPSAHFSPEAFDRYYGPLLECGVAPVTVPEFQGTVNYAAEWGLPVVCTEYAAERCKRPDFVIRRLDFVPSCAKYLARLASHRTPSQILLWDLVEAELSAGARPAASA